MASKSEPSASEKQDLVSRSVYHLRLNELGQPDVGHLGLGRLIEESFGFSMIQEMQGKSIVQVAAGANHMVCLTKDGQVYTFTSKERSDLGQVEGIDGKVVKVTAGECHSVALTEDDNVFYWGTFMDSKGSLGLTPHGDEWLPIPLATDLRVTDIASGDNHVVLLTGDGELYTVGRAEEGQLGRVEKEFTLRGGTKGTRLLLEPELVPTKKITNIWAGSDNTYALTSEGEVLVCGKNHNNILKETKGENLYSLQRIESFTKISQKTGLKSISCSKTYALALDKEGKVYTIGFLQYAAAGCMHDFDFGPALVATEVKAFDNVSCICASSLNAYAVLANGRVMVWGFGESITGSREVDLWTPKVIEALKHRKVVGVSSIWANSIFLVE